MSRMNVADLGSNAQLSNATFLLAAMEEATDRNGNGYLKLTLRDKTGDIDARYWRVPAHVPRQLSVGGGVAVSGRIEEYRGVSQVRVTNAFASELEDLSDFLPTARRPQEKMIDELQRLIHSIQEPNLKMLIKGVLGDAEFQARFFAAPAAKLYHHACVGGLLEHSLDVTRQVVSVSKRYPELDRDLAATVALLHDIGKVDCYQLQGAFEFADRGKLLGHIYVGAALVERAIDRIESFPEELRLRVLHAILAHHGELEKGSPVTPRTPEAIALHYADNLDGSLRGWVDHVNRESPTGVAWTLRSNMHGGDLYVGHGDDSGEG